MSSIAATTISSPQRHQPSQLPQHQSPLKKREINLTDDPDKLLNDWLGELENLIGVSWLFIFCLKFIIYRYWKVFNGNEAQTLVRSRQWFWSSKSVLKNVYIELNIEIQFRRKSTAEQQLMKQIEWFSQTKYLQAICVLLCISSVFVDFSIY